MNSNAPVERQYAFQKDAPALRASKIINKAICLLQRGVPGDYFDNVGKTLPQEAVFQCRQLSAR